MPAMSRQSRRPDRRGLRRWLALGGVVVLVVAAGGVAAWQLRPTNGAVPTTTLAADGRSAEPTAGSTAAATGTTGATERDTAAPAPATSAAPLPSASAATACTYTEAPEGAPGLRKPPPPPAQASHGTVRADVKTNAGTITLSLAGEAAPCAVNSFVHLIRNAFYDDTPCHRLTTIGIYVLQCGDPSGSGTGGPGYQYPEENLPASQPAYPRGTVAMANAGPGTNGSQFFLVFKDSEIDPNYTVFGTITAGLEILDQIAAAGSDDSGGEGDGHPNKDLTIESFTLS